MRGYELVTFLYSHRKRKMVAIAASVPMAIAAMSGIVNEIHCGGGGENLLR